MSEMNAIYRVKQYILKLIKMENWIILVSYQVIYQLHVNVKTDDVYDGIGELMNKL